MKIEPSKYNEILFSGSPEENLRYAIECGDSLCKSLRSKDTSASVIKLSLIHTVRIRLKT